MQHEVGRRDSDEQQQRWLDDGGEDAGLSYEEDGGDAAEHVHGGECATEFLIAGTGLERDAGDRRDRRDHHRTPGRHTRAAAQGGALLVCDRPLSWHS